MGPPGAHCAPRGPTVPALRFGGTGVTEKSERVMEELRGLAVTISNLWAEVREMLVDRSYEGGAVDGVNVSSFIRAVDKHLPYLRP